MNLTFNTIWRVLLVMLLAVIVGRFAVVGLPKVLFNHQSSDGDESAYLALGLDVLEAGTLNDGTRPFLYPLVLSPVAEREWRYFTSAKLITLGLGAATIVAVFVVGVRLFSWETALLAAFVLAANKEFHIRAATVYADTLLALIMVGAWYFLIRSVSHGWRACLWAGVLVGLAMLTKGSAPVLLAAWGVMALAHYRGQIFRRFELALVPLVFIVTVSPLLIYNMQTFGSPTYNFATQHIMWMDRLAQINTAESDDLPTLGTYLATHTPADMVARVWEGLDRLNPVVARSVIPSRTIEPWWVGVALAMMAVGVTGYALRQHWPGVREYFRTHQDIWVYTVALNALFYVFYVWYVAGSSAETRFIVPLLAPIYLVLADVVVSLVRHGFARRPIMRGAMVGGAIVAGLAWVTVTTIPETWALTVNPYEHDRSANAEVEELVQWFAADAPTQETRLSFGPSKSLPLWKFPPNFTLERLPVEVTTWQAMQDYINTASPDYVIIDDDTARRRREALGVVFRRTEGLVTFDLIPPGWSLEHLHPGWPCRWCVFAPVEATAEPVAVFDHGLELLDYRVVRHAETAARVILTWRTTQPVATDYTAFVHFTALDGFVLAQQDHPPFDNLYPTSRWNAGEVFADRYDLRFNVAAGDYLLLTGFYDPATGKRLPVVAGPAGPSPASVLVSTFTVGQRATASLDAE